MLQTAFFCLFFCETLASKCLKELTNCVESATTGADFEFCAKLKEKCERKPHPAYFDQFHSNQFRFGDQISENQAIPLVVRYINPKAVGILND